MKDKDQCSSSKPIPNIEYKVASYVFDTYLGLNVFIESINGDQITFDAGIHLRNFDDWKKDRWKEVFKTDFRYTLNPKRFKYRFRFEKVRLL